MGPKLLSNFTNICVNSNKKSNSYSETRQIAQFLISIAKHYKISDIEPLKSFINSNEYLKQEFGKEFINI